MASFDSINYSLRPSKSVQRGLIFEGIKSISDAIDLSNPAYIGLGSIWFTDFVMAHKVLNIVDMVSIESNEIGFQRACFNKTYRTITVIEGRTGEKLPEVLDFEGYKARPWVVWLDYDSALDEDIVSDMQWILTNAPPNSVVLFTFSATQNAYGKPVNRPNRIRSLLGSVVPDNLSKDDCDKETIPITLARLGVDFLRSEAADMARVGGFIEAFKIAYYDSVGMVTIGGILPSKGAIAAARDVVSQFAWKCIIDEVIEAPPMTLKEVATLQSELPTIADLTRARVQELGFDLHEGQVRSFQRYYKYLPSFAEVVT